MASYIVGLQDPILSSAAVEHRLSRIAVRYLKEASVFEHF
jgi:hypothetical protein